VKASQPSVREPFFFLLREPTEPVRDNPGCEKQRCKPPICMKQSRKRLRLEKFSCRSAKERNDSHHCLGANIFVVESSLPLHSRVAYRRPPVDMLVIKQNTENGYMCKSSKSTGKRDWLTVAKAIIVSLVVLSDSLCESSRIE
jgi:hypothetical protein